MPVSLQSRQEGEEEAAAQEEVLLLPSAAWREEELPPPPPPGEEEAAPPPPPRRVYRAAFQSQKSKVRERIDQLTAAPCEKGFAVEVQQQALPGAQPTRGLF